MAKKTQKNQSQSLKNNVDKAIYDRFTNLKFVELSGVKLHEETKKELAELEKQVSEFEGQKSLRTQRAAISNEQVLLVEGMPIPLEYLAIIEKCINPSYYIDVVEKEETSEVTE